MAAVRWTGFFGSSLGKLSSHRHSSASLYLFRKAHELDGHDGEIRSLYLRLDLSPVAGSALARQVRQRAMARGLVLCNLSVSGTKKYSSFFFFFFALGNSCAALKLSQVRVGSWGARNKNPAPKSRHVDEESGGLLTAVRHGC